MSSKFVVVTPAFNCENDILKTIFSVIAQSYTNWRMVIYDDMSTDNTPQVVEDISKKLCLGNKLAVVSREEKYGEVRNTLDAIQTIDNDDIVCRLDAGDWLTENDTLWALDAAYSQEKDPAVIWTRHRWGYTTQNISAPLPSNADVYKHPWVTSHLKTFRKNAINDINEKNFLDDEGTWIMIACDQAVFLPILHKAYLEGRERVHLPMCCYHYNIDLGDSKLFSCDRSQKQKVSAETIRARGFIE